MQSEREQIKNVIILQAVFFLSIDWCVVASNDQAEIPLQRRDRLAGPCTAQLIHLRAFRWNQNDFAFSFSFFFFFCSHLSTSYNCLQSMMINSESIREDEILDWTLQFVERDSLCVCWRFCTWQHQIIFNWFQLKHWNWVACWHRNISRSLLQWMYFKSSRGGLKRANKSLFIVESR